MLAGSEAYISSLTSYRMFGAAASAGVPGADSIYETLKARLAKMAQMQNLLNPFLAT